MVASDATEYILQELARRLDEVTSRLENGLSRFDSTYIRKDVYDQAQKTAEAEHTAQELKIKNLESRLDDLEDDKKWLVRLVIGFIVLGVLGAVIGFAKAAGA